MKERLAQLSISSSAAFSSLPYDVLQAYATNQLAADKAFKREGVSLAGAMREVGRDGGRVFVILGDDAEDPKRQLETKLRKVRLWLSDKDGSSVDVATELKHGDTMLVVCGKGLGADDEYVTFDDCTIWSSEDEPTTPSASSSGSAPRK